MIRCFECSRTGTLQSLSSSFQVASLLRPLLAQKRVEFFYVVPLNVKLCPIGRPVRIAQGSVAACLVHPREVFRPAVVRRAHSIVVAHNHPSGDPTPSDEDQVLTRRLSAVGEVLGIRLLDHVVITRSDWFSFADAGILQASGRFG